MASFIPLGTYKVEYIDGSTESVKSNFAGVAEVERLWPKDEDNPMGTMLAYGVWCYLGKPGADFDKWAATVHLIEPVSEVRPMKPALDPSEPEVGLA